MIKVCSKCGVEKNLSEFHNDNRRPDGVRSDCKQCRNKGTRNSPPALKSDKTCESCGVVFSPSSNRQKWCVDCGTKIKSEAKKEYHRDYHKSNYTKIGYSHLVLTKANAYKDGIGIYAQLKKMTVEDLECERCGSDKHLLVHHKDRNRRNNEVPNLELLCKSCHQKEHLIRDKKGRFFKSK